MSTTHGFELLREQDISELRARVQLWRHQRTGAELLSIQTDEENKVFGIVFRTPVPDSTGVAHILEHAVLCGSRKYPLKDPFIELAAGSLNTFVNAFTYPDKTCYPVASQNLQDFYNLVEVYLDTVFYPLLTRETFQEQGWHLEAPDPAGPLHYKGVVFNEMKGAFGSPERRLADLAERAMFPATTYRECSGGDPACIPDLTYEQLVAFHRNYYHPSNSRIFFYGDDDPTERLRLLDACLSAFDFRPVDSAVALQAPFPAPIRITGTYPAGGEEKAMVAVTWIMTEQTDPETALALRILEEILIGNPAAPLRRALIESGLGEDLSTHEMDLQRRQALFTTGLRGVARENVDAVERLMLQSLEQLAGGGLAPETVEASLNTVEFALRERNAGRFPRGLLLMLEAMTTWMYDGDPLAPLAFEKPLAAVRAGVASGGYFEGLIRRLLLDNPHRSTAVVLPDPDLDRRETESEQARLETIRAGLTPQELHRIREEAERLKQLQSMPNSPELLQKLPGLRVADLERTVRTVPQTTFPSADTPVLYHDLFTSGILYLDLGLNLQALPQELVPYAPLFGRALLELGTEMEDYVRLTQRIGSRTGGLWTRLFAATHRLTRMPCTYLFLRGKALASHSDALLAICRDVLLHPRLDNRERFLQIAQEAKSELEAELAPAGTHFVDIRLRAHFSLAGLAAEQTGGISQLLFLRRLLQRAETDWPGVLADLERIRALLVNRESLIVNVTLDRENWKRSESHLEALLNALPNMHASSPGPETPWVQDDLARYEGLTLPGQVNYCGKGANLYAHGYRSHGSEEVALRFLRSTWLWDQVRKEGGAYGVHCRFDELSGILTYLSYRDPNLLRTLDVFDRSGAFLRDRILTETEVTRAIIGTIGETDQYQLPDARGFTALVRTLTGVSDETRQRRRDEILATTARDFRRFGDLLESVRELADVVVLGNAAAITSANSGGDTDLKVLKVV